jgi:hypothetical protein
MPVRPTASITPARSRYSGGGHTVASQTVIVSPNPVTSIQNRDIEFAEVARAFLRRDYVLIDRHLT